MHKPRQIHIHFCAINNIQTAYFVKYTVRIHSHVFSCMRIRRLNFIAKFKPSKILALWDIVTCRLQIDRYLDGSSFFFFFRFQQFFPECESRATPQIARSVSTPSYCESF